MRRNKQGNSTQAPVLGLFGAVQLWMQYNYKKVRENLQIIDPSSNDFLKDSFIIVGKLVSFCNNIIFSQNGSSQG